MQRLRLGIVLLVSAAIGLSAWIAIDAGTDAQPQTLSEHLPRDDEPQEQQSAQQSEPAPETAPELEQSQADQSVEQSADTQQETPSTADTAPDPEASTNADPVAPEPASEPAAEPDDAVDDRTMAASLDPAEVIVHAYNAAPLLDAAKIGEAAISEAEIGKTEIGEAGQPMTADGRSQRYVVRAGDTLSAVALQFDVPRAELIDANGLDQPNKIAVGFELIIPGATPDSPESPPVQSVSIEIAPSMMADNTYYGTVRDHGRDADAPGGGVDTLVVMLSREDSAIRLVTACIEGARRTYIMHPSAVDAATDPLVRVYWRLDDGPLQTDRWRTAPQALESSRATSFARGLDEAARVWIRMGTEMWTFDTELLGPSEIGYNFAICVR